MRKDLIVPVLLAVAGWYVVDYLRQTRDVNNDRRRYRVEFLIESYRRLEGASQRDPIPADCARAVEGALADIQLLGSARLAGLARDFGCELRAGGAPARLSCSQP